MSKCINLLNKLRTIQENAAIHTYYQQDDNTESPEENQVSSVLGKIDPEGKIELAGKSIVYTGYKSNEITPELERMGYVLET